MKMKALLNSMAGFHFVFCLAEEQERARKYSTFERSQVSKQVHGIKQQLSHERNLKLDAFHQVDNLVQQV